MYTVESSLGKKLADLALASIVCPGVIFDARGTAVVLDGRGTVLATPVTALPHAVNMIVDPQVLQQACGRVATNVAIDVDGDQVMITADNLRWSHPHDQAEVNALPDWRAAFPALAVARVRHFTVSVAQLQRVLAACTTDIITITLDRDGLNQPAVIWSGEDGKHVAVALPPHNTKWWWDSGIARRLAGTLEKIGALPNE